MGGGVTCVLGARRTDVAWRGAKYKLISVLRCFVFTSCDSLASLFRPCIISCVLIKNLILIHVLALNESERKFSYSNGNYASFSCAMVALNHHRVSAHIRGANYDILDRMVLPSNEG